MIAVVLSEGERVGVVASICVPVTCTKEKQINPNVNIRVWLGKKIR